MKKIFVFFALVVGVCTLQAQIPERSKSIFGDFFSNCQVPDYRFSAGVYIDPLFVYYSIWDVSIYGNYNINDKLSAGVEFNLWYRKDKYYYTEKVRYINIYPRLIYNQNLFQRLYWTPRLYFGISFYHSSRTSKYPDSNNGTYNDNFFNLGVDILSFRYDIENIGVTLSILDVSIEYPRLIKLGAEIKF